MKGEMGMDLIDRYVYDVGRRLPAKQREDIEKELKSLLLDALEARAGGKEPAQEDVAAVLREFGSPADVAAKYAGERYVIGPRLYPAYKIVLLIVLCATAFGLIMSFITEYIFTPVGWAPWSHLLQLAGSMISSAWGAIGILTVIFWGIERGIAHGGGKLPEDEARWDPRRLPPVPKNRKSWKAADSIAAMVFIVAALIIFNGFPEIISVFNKFDGQWHSVRILSDEALAVYLPLWNISWACTLALHMALLARRRWELGTNIAHIALQLFGVAVAVVMLTGPALLNPQMAEFGMTPEAVGFSSIVPELNIQMRWVFVLVIIICLFETGRGVYRIVRDARG
jgi:hypothetical protein